MSRHERHESIVDAAIHRCSELAFRLRRTASAFHRFQKHTGTSFAVCGDEVCAEANKTLHEHASFETRCRYCPHAGGGR